MNKKLTSTIIATALLSTSLIPASANRATLLKYQLPTKAN